jgi:hypothetical protein
VWKCFNLLKSLVRERHLDAAASTTPVNVTVRPVVLVRHQNVNIRWIVNEIDKIHISPFY